jgi:hypothetical protein
MKIGESHSYTVIWNDCYQTDDKELTIEVTATSGVFPTIYRTVLRGVEYEVSEAALMKQSPQTQIIKMAISSFEELKEKYVVNE